MASNREKNFISSLVTTIKKKILNLEICDFNLHIQYLIKKMNKHKENLTVLSNNELVDAFENYYDKKLVYITNNTSKKLCQKIDTLYYKTYNSSIIPNYYYKPNKPSTHTVNTQVIEPQTNGHTHKEIENKWIVNLADVQLPNYVDVLKLGDNFNFNNKFDNYTTLEHIKCLEQYLNHNETDESRSCIIRNKILNIVINSSSMTTTVRDGHTAPSMAPNSTGN